MRIQVTIGLLLTATVAAAADLPAEVIAETQSAVKESMKDPDSARFKDLRLGKTERIDGSDDPNIVCGFVNGKNSMGGYVGFGIFAYDRSTKKVEFYRRNSWGSWEGRMGYCGIALGLYKA